MEKLQSYEQYSQVLADFKAGRTRCGTNRLMTREELAALIEAGKLWYEQIGDTLWFFTHEGYFYTGVYYVPADKAIEMQAQDMDVVAELMGKGDRYDQRRDEELVAAGFEKRDKRFEFFSQLDDSIDQLRKQNDFMRTFWERRGFTYRTATRDDYPELHALWLEMIGKERYTVTVMTDAELEEMEEYGRCSVICDPKGKIVAASNYTRPNEGVHGYFYYTAGYRKGSGLGASSYFDASVHAFQEGCTKLTGRVREDNDDSNNMTQRAQQRTGKYFWQFVYKTDVTQAGFVLDKEENE